MLHMVECIACSTMEKSYHLMQPKWDTLKKHEGRHKATRDMLAYNGKKMVYGYKLQAQDKFGFVQC